MERVADFAGGFGGSHELVEGLEGWVCATEDEGVVAGVDGGGDEGGGFGVCAGDAEKVDACMWGKRSG